MQNTSARKTRHIGRLKRQKRIIIKSALLQLLDSYPKKQNVDTVFNSLKAGHYTDERGRAKPDEKVFTIKCASPTGENSNGLAKGNGASNRYWRTKQAGDTYTIDCLNRSITAKYSGRKIYFNQ